MELSIFLAKLLGLYFLIAGGIVMVRQKSFMTAITNVVRNRSLLIVVALVELAAGLAIVIAHPIFTPDWQGIISAIGVWVVIESIYYLTMPYNKLTHTLRTFNSPTWYTSGGLAAVVIGGYLAGIGFGLW